ncbi:hypothetical protein M0R45_030738 [Rubus argutus]|uniref:MHC class I antigen n=1 Tax=Rubus argutus TaxID=59490 RepID=A0AAW1WBJ1_RUBAR
MCSSGRSRLGRDDERRDCTAGDAAWAACWAERDQSPSAGYRRDDLGRAWRKGSTALWSESLVESLEAEEDGDGVRWQGG